MKYILLLFAVMLIGSANAQTAEEYFDRGLEKHKANDDKGAIQDITKSIELNPSAAKYVVRGSIKAMQKEDLGALQDLNKAIELNPQYKTAYSMRGMIRVALKEYAAAIQDLDKAIEYDTQDADNYYYRGRAKYFLKEFTGALADLNKAIELNPRHEHAYAIRGVVKLELRDFSGSSLDLKNADNVAKGANLQSETEHKKDREEALIDEGFKKIEKKDYAGAIGEYSTAIAFNPKNKKLYVLRADARQQFKDYPNSIADYTKAIEIDPTLADAYISRGLTKIMAFNAVGGCEDFKKAATLGDTSAMSLIKEFCTSATKTESQVATTTPSTETEQPQVTKNIVKSKFTDPREGGGTYHAIKINNQIWMSENLNVSTFINGDIIPEVRTAEAWKKAGVEKRPAWCYYNNDPKNEDYGKLYNWYAVHDSRGLASKGWHIPSDGEWTTLTNFLQEDLAVKKMKAPYGWTTNVSGSNESGFAGLPGGFRSNTGIFNQLGYYGGWWSSSSSQAEGAWNRALYNDIASKEVYKGEPYKASGLSVRCIKD